MTFVMELRIAPPHLAPRYQSRNIPNFRELLSHWIWFDNNVHGLTAYVGRLKPTLMYRLVFTAEVSRRTSYKLLNTSAAYAAKLSH